MSRTSANQTWYEATGVKRVDRPQLDYVAEADVCVVGGGLAGLTTAREFARRGWDVVLLEADKVGSGASGRNGGFVLEGFAQGALEIEEAVGIEAARSLHALSREGMSYVRAAVEATRMPGVDVRPGALKVVRHAGGVDAFRAAAERMTKVYDHPLLFWPRERVREVLLTTRYEAGLYDPSAFHLHPLNYCLGVAAGARIYEASAATDLDLRSIRRVVRTAKGAVRCNKVVFCTSASLRRSVERRIAGSVVPVSTYIAVTEELGERLRDVIRFSGAVTDTRRAGNYFRVVGGSRILWGGGITTRRREPRNLGALLARDMAEVFPALSGVRIDYAWSGVMAYAAHKMPQIAEVERDVWVASAFGGHGLNTTAMAALAVTRAIIDRHPSYRLFAPFGLKPTFGPLGRMAAQLEYWRLQAQDLLEERWGR
jgi:gamma-glutamylputrescine oxidase